VSTTPEWVITRLGAAHDRAAFASGDDPLDRFLREGAVQAMRDRLSAVFVATPTADPTRLAGYYTLSPAAVPAGELPDAVRVRLPRYPELPAALLGRLAVDAAFAGRGLGALLVADALRRVERQRDLPVLFLVVDAYPTARPFYVRLGFVPIPDRETRLFFALSRLSRGAALAPDP